MKFIHNILFGSSKSKNGKELSDLDKYKPWKEIDFSGKIKYSLGNGKKYEIFREFGKRNPKVYDENAIDVSKSFEIDKTKGINFFYEQTGIDEDLFLSSMVTMQQEVKIDEKKQNVILQKIANLVSSRR